MRIIVITQDEPFFLAENFSYLLKIFPNHSKIVGCVVNSVSPFGKKENFLKKALKTFKIFGYKFFIYYSFKYLFKILSPKSGLKHVLKINKIPVIKLKENINAKNSIDTIKNFEPDLLVSILGNQIFKQNIIDLAPKGCINLHTALLPKYRGLMPTFWVLKNNEKYTGVSVFFVDKGIDSGPIIVQKKILIDTNSQEKLILKTKKIGMDAIVESIDLIHKGKFRLIKNDEYLKSYYSFPTKKDVLDFLNNGKTFF